MGILPMDKTKKNQQIKTISLIEAADIVVNKKPRGLFVAKAENLSEWVAVRNTGLRVETESFNTEAQCIEWLQE